MEAGQGVSTTTHAGGMTPHPYASMYLLSYEVRKRVGTNTLRRGAGVCWTWDMDMPDLPVIEIQDTHKIGRKGVWRRRAELRDGSVTRDRVETARCVPRRLTEPYRLTLAMLPVP